MKLFSRWFRKLQTRARAASRPIVAWLAEELEGETLIVDFARVRSAERLPLGVKTTLHLADGSTVQCKVADASRDGVRLVLDAAALPQAAFGGGTFFFNGYFMRKCVRVVWSQEREGRFEAGARFTGSSHNDLTIMENFVRYLRWRSTITTA